ncbi:hypothetical protein A0H81_00368 [Grifola frondosa]|uniref:Uncharacterized protein n=1 Tax=Grifola frondosa TaxID=5627 RepID=A0A1C7MPS2_GRIFR|nr:hypothetical protein A0H81_00368 [Grifola frondosa]
MLSHRLRFDYADAGRDPTLFSSSPLQVPRRKWDTAMNYRNHDYNFDTRGYLQPEPTRRFFSYMFAGLIIDVLFGGKSFLLELLKFLLHR